jgi:hypothetical protein
VAEMSSNLGTGKWCLSLANALVGANAHMRLPFQSSNILRPDRTNYDIQTVSTTLRTWSEIVISGEALLLLCPNFDSL